MEVVLGFVEGVLDKEEARRPSEGTSLRALISIGWIEILYCCESESSC